MENFSRFLQMSGQPSVKNASLKTCGYRTMVEALHAAPERFPRLGGTSKERRVRPSSESSSKRAP